MHGTTLALVASLAAVALLLAQPAAGQTATDLACSQCVGSSDIANEAVGSGKIADGSIKSNDLAANAVKTPNLNNGSVTFNKLATGVRGALDGAIADMTFTRVYNADESIVGVECPVDTIAVSASCGCHSNEGNNNVGMLDLCTSLDVGSIAACLPDGATFDPQLPDPVAEVEAVCMGATTTDGSIWIPTISEPAVDVQSPGAQLEWRKRQYAAYEAVRARAEKEASIHRSRLQK